MSMYNNSGHAQSLDLLSRYAAQKTPEKRSSVLYASLILEKP